MLGGGRRLGGNQGFDDGTLGLAGGATCGLAGGILSESGFSGFYRRVFGRQALIHIRIGAISSMAKTASWANRNPENPANPDSDKYAQLPHRNEEARNLPMQTHHLV